jgi:hypothetical protein
VNVIAHPFKFPSFDIRRLGLTLRGRDIAPAGERHPDRA